jgi:hypothetical protein
METQDHQISAAPLAPRSVSYEGNGYYSARQGVSEEKLAEHLDSKVEVKVAGIPKQYFFFLRSPHRNGNSTFLRKLSAKVGASRSLERIEFVDPKAFDPNQYPRIVHAILPRFLDSHAERRRIRRLTEPTRAKALRFLANVVVPAIFLGILEIISAILSGGFGGGQFPSPVQVLTVAIDAPIWVHASIVLLVVASQAATNLSERLRHLFSKKTSTPLPYILSPEDSSLLLGEGPSDVTPLRVRFEQLSSYPTLMTLIVIDKADALDSYSREALLEFLFNPRQKPLANTIILVHLPPGESLLYRDLMRKITESVARPDELTIELTLEEVDLDHRIEIAKKLNKSEDDARSTPFIADLVEQETPLKKSQIRIVRELLAEDSEDGAVMASGAVLTLLASAGSSGPHRFSRRRLRTIFTRQEGTVGRWLRAFGTTPPSPAALMDTIDRLEHRENISLIRREQPEQWLVEPEIRGTVLREAAASSTWLTSVHAFWATYIFERLATLKVGQAGYETTDPEADETISEEDEENRLLELTHHILLLRLPRKEELAQLGAAQHLATVLLRAASATTSGLLEIALFERAHAVVRVVFEQILKFDFLWTEPAFVREVENFAKDVWRLAMISGVSETITGFHQLLISHGAEGQAAGISTSVKIYDIYNRAISLEPIDVEEAFALPIAGGSETTRSYLENIRRYASNIFLFRRYGLVLECLEEYPSSFMNSQELILNQLREAANAPNFSIFEFLVRLQTTRARLALGAYNAVLGDLETIAERLTRPEDEPADHPYLEEAFREFIYAEGRIILFSMYLSWQRFESEELDAKRLRNIIGIFFSSAHEQIRPETLLEEVEQALGNAHLLQDLGGILLGKACLLNARLRYVRLIYGAAGRLDTEDSISVWESAVVEAQRLRCNHLWLGSLVKRANIESLVETAAACLKEICLETRRLGLRFPLRFLARHLASLATIVGETGIRKVAADSLKIAIEDTSGAHRTSRSFLEWCDLKIKRAQQVRILGEAQESADELKECLDMSPDDFSTELQAFAVSTYLSSRLQASWVHRVIGNQELEHQYLEEALAYPGVESWGGFHHLVLERLNLKARQGSDETSSIVEAVEMLKVSSNTDLRSFDRIGVVTLAARLLNALDGSRVPEQTRGAILTFARETAPLADEHAGIESALNFLEVAVNTPEIADDELREQWQYYMVREAESAERLNWFENNLSFGNSQPLLHILKRFQHRIRYRATDETMAALEAQIEELGIDSLELEQVRSLISRSRAIETTGGLILLDPAVLILMRYKSEIETSDKSVVRSSASGGEVSQALLDVTRELLRQVASEKLLAPQLAQVILRYLKLVNRFAKVGR